MENRYIDLFFVLLICFPFIVLAQPCSVCSLAPGTVTKTDLRCKGDNTGTATANPTGGNAPYTYLWSTGATTQSISNLAAGTYTVTIIDASCVPSGPELVTNGNFSGGNTGFASQYIYCNSPNCLWDEGNYAIGSNASAFHQNFTFCPDHTGPPTNRNFMIVNGVGIPNTNAWCQSISGVLQNKNYNFTAWVKSERPESPAKLQFSINGVQLCQIVTAPSTPCNWVQFCCVWSSGASATKANICLVNQNTAADGNDFGLDDVSFQQCLPCTVTTVVTITEPAPLATTVSSTDAGCSVSNGTATANAAGGTPGYTYVWGNGQTTQTATGLNGGNYTVTVSDNNKCSFPATVSVGLTTAPAVTVSAFQSTCGNSNGLVTASASGGTPPGIYVYSWAPGGYTSSQVTGLAAGIYTVTITDGNGCTDTKTTNVTNAKGPAAIISVTANVLCYSKNTGSATITPSGGTQPYTYSWNNGETAQNITGLAAGPYTVTVADANGCSIVKPFSITQPTKALTVNTVNSGSSCGTNANGVITSYASNGTGPYTYLWSNGKTTQTISHILAGSYTLIVTDANGCKEIIVSALPANLKPHANFSSAPVISCDGVHINFKDASSDALSWHWTFGNTGSSNMQNPAFIFPYNGVYMVTLIVTNPPCADTLSKPVAVSDILDYFKITPTNVFTPNSDGFNDCFLPNFTEAGSADSLNLKACTELEVFDRWGVRVFKSVGADNCWDGNNNKNNKPALDGIYFYLAKLGKATFKGYVTLLRHK